LAKPLISLPPSRFGKRDSVQEARRYVFCALRLIGDRPTDIGCAGASAHRHHRHEQAETKGVAGQTKTAGDRGTTRHIAIIAIAGKDLVATGGTDAARHRPVIDSAGRLRKRTGSVRRLVIWG
jgi:hypothetical protein